MRENRSGSADAVNVYFFAPYALALFDPAYTGNFGGAETRAARFARGIAALSGFSVTCAAFGATSQVVDDVRLIPVPNEIVSPPAPEPPCKARRRRSLLKHAYLGFHAAGRRIDRFPYVRFRKPHWGLLWQIPLLSGHRVWTAAHRRLARIARRFFPKNPTLPEPIVSPAFACSGASVVCVFGASELASHVIASCRAFGIPSILFLASDSDLSEINHHGSLAYGPHFDSGHLCHLALTQATAVVAQTEAQRDLLASRFARAGIVIRNPWPASDSLTEADARTPDDVSRFALWIGRAEHANKRPELCIELAKRCPTVPFTMILNPANREVFQEICDAAPKNVTIIESVSFHEIDAYFRRASVLVNTSLREGFPNAFLQAASHGVPILSLKVDPDGFLVRERCGDACGDDLDRMAARLQNIYSDAGLARQMGEAGRSYVRRVHELNGRVEELASLLRAIVCGEPHETVSLPDSQRRPIAREREAA